MDSTCGSYRRNGQCVLPFATREALLEVLSTSSTPEMSLAAGTGTVKKGRIKTKKRPEGGGSYGLQPLVEDEGCGNW